MSIEEMQKAIYEKCKYLFQLHGLKVPKIVFSDIQTNSLGAMTGWYIVKKKCFHYILFCNSLIKNNFQEYINDIVPHEVAHSVQNIKYPNLKNPHGKEWKALNLAMGGSGDIYHNMT